MPIRTNDASRRVPKGEAMLQRILVNGLVAVVLVSPVRAQEHPAVAAEQATPPARHAAPEPLRRWSVALGIGTTSGGPGPGLEAGMRSAGFADTLNGSGLFGAGPIQNPFTRAGFGAIGFPIALDVEYRFTQTLGLSVLVARSPIGETLGYHAPQSFLFVQHAVDTLALCATVTLGPLRLAIGPARHTVKAKLDGSSGQDTWDRTPRLGFVASAGLRAPVRSRVYLDVAAQYRHVGEVTVGPFTSSTGTIVGPSLPPTAVRFDHWYIGVGPGVRF